VATTLESTSHAIDDVAAINLFMDEHTISLSGEYDESEYLSKTPLPLHELMTMQDYSLPRIQHDDRRPMCHDGAAIDEFVMQEMSTYVNPDDIWQACFDEPPDELAISPKFECGDQGCAMNARCTTGAPAVSHMCYVDDCGDAGCNRCPSWIAERLKHIVFKTWCSYVCIQVGTSPPKVVAIGAGAVSSFKGIFIGPFCVPF
jgi:hypothetical protein